MGQPRRRPRKVHALHQCRIRAENLTGAAPLLACGIKLNVTQRLTRRWKCPHCGHRLRLFPAPTACPRCGRQIYASSDRRRRY